MNTFCILGPIILFSKFKESIGSDKFTVQYMFAKSN